MQLLHGREPGKEGVDDCAGQGRQCARPRYRENISGSGGRIHLGGKVLDEISSVGQIDIVRAGRDRGARDPVVLILKWTGAVDDDIRCSPAQVILERRITGIELNLSAWPAAGGDDLDAFLIR